MFRAVGMYMLYNLAFLAQLATFPGFFGAGAKDVVRAKTALIAGVVAWFWLSGAERDRRATAVCVVVERRLRGRVQHDRVGVQARTISEGNTSAGGDTVVDTRPCCRHPWSATGFESPGNFSETKILAGLFKLFCRNLNFSTKMFKQSCKDFGIQKVSFGTRPRRLVDTRGRRSGSSRRELF